MTQALGTADTFAWALFGLFVLANVMSFVLFRADWVRSVTGGSRIPQRTLLLSAALGGILTALYAQRRYRSAPRAFGFGFLLFAIFLTEGVGGLTLGSPSFRQNAAEAAASGYEMASAQVSKALAGLKTQEVASADTGNDAAAAIVPHRFGPGSGDKKKK